MATSSYVGFNLSLQVLVSLAGFFLPSIQRKDDSMVTSPVFSKILKLIIAHPFVYAGTICAAIWFLTWYVLKDQERKKAELEKKRSKPTAPPLPHEVPPPFNPSEEE